jgi:hypothetical protein
MILIKTILILETYFRLKIKLSLIWKILIDYNFDFIVPKSGYNLTFFSLGLQSSITLKKRYTRGTSS